MRDSPAIGSSLDILGMMASQENKNPPVAPDASIATTMVTSMRGSTSKNACVACIAKACGIKAGVSRNLRSSVKPAAKYTESWWNQMPPKDMSIITAPIITPAAGSSCERATWPSSRARFSLRAVGSSVRSALSSAMVLLHLIAGQIGRELLQSLAARATGCARPCWAMPPSKSQSRPRS